MKGTIRLIAGLMVTLGAAGGIDNAQDKDLPWLIVIALVGLAVMAWAVMDINKDKK